MAMEPKLRAHLKSLFETYNQRFGGKISSLSARVAGDARFYDKLAGGVSLFTAQRYDLVVATFSQIWPDDLPWPPEVERVSLSDVKLRPRKPRAKTATAAGNHEDAGK